MKKTRQNPLVWLIPLLLALDSGSVVWGQITAQYANCNNDYGAGESTIISAPAMNANSTVVAPGSLGRITLGGNTQNQVLYAANGNPAGQVNWAGSASTCRVSAGNYTYPTWFLPDSCGVFPGVYVASGTSVATFSDRNLSFRFK